MDAKGAIEFLDDMIGSFKCISSLNIKDINNKKNEIVYLLEQGEEDRRILKHIRVITKSEQVKDIITHTILGG